MNQTAFRNETPVKGVFKNLKALTQDYIPRRLQHRDEQIENIQYHLSSLIRHGLLMNNIVVFGPPGTGKTHSVKHILKTLKGRVQSFYERANQDTSGHAFFRSFLERNFNLTLHPRESISVYYKAFEKAINNTGSILLVFDDIHYLLNDDPKGLDGLLFYLSRLENNLGLLLVGNIKLTDLSLALTPGTKSSLKLRSVFFPKYNSLELKDILTERAQEALTKKALAQSRAAIANIAAITTQSWASARYALDLLKEAGTVSEIKLGKNHIPLEAVEQAKEMLEASHYVEQIRNLPPQPLAVLDAVYRSRGKEGLSTADVYSAYKSICDNWGLEVFTLRKVNDFITELEASGLISCRLVSRGRLGRGRFIRWPPNPSLDEVYKRIRKEDL